MYGAHPPEEKSVRIAGMLTWTLEAHDEHADAIMVYREPDLAHDLERAQEALIAVNYLEKAIHPFGKERDAMRQNLLALRLLQQF